MNQRAGDVTDSASQPSVPSSSRTRYHWLAAPSTVTRVFLGSTRTSLAEASPRSRRFARGTETMRMIAGGAGAGSARGGAAGADGGAGVDGVTGRAGG